MPAATVLPAAALAALALAETATAANGARPHPIWQSHFARPVGLPSNATGGSQAAIVELGHDLFRDTRLSGANDQSCASCHQPERAFTDGIARRQGRRGFPLPHTVPTLYGIGFAARLDWDGGSESLESQMERPIQSRHEMDGRWPEILARLRGDTAIASRFDRAFAGRVPTLNRKTVKSAIAAYQRTIVPPRTRFDAWVAGDASALSADERAGFDLFTGRGACVTCHRGWRLTDDRRHDIGLTRPAHANGPGAPRRFKTPTLRAIAETAPYMHDGRFTTLGKVIDHYAGGVTARPTLATNIQPGLRLSPDERRQLIAFLKTL